MSSPNWASLKNGFRSMLGRDNQMQGNTRGTPPLLTRHTLQRMNRQTVAKPSSIQNPEISALLMSHFNGHEDRARILSLRGSNAQLALELMQALCDDHELWEKWARLCPNIDRKKIAPLMAKLSQESEQFPFSLYLQASNVGQVPDRGGGFSDVFKGTLHGRVVALKRLRYFANMTTEERRKNTLDFARESLMWLQMRHNNIVGLLGIDIVRFANMPCMVLPWLEDGHILEYMDQQQFTPGPHQLNKWLLEVAQGLEYLHDEEVVHGDVRGANVLMWNGTAKLADFGLSVFANEHSRNFNSPRGGVDEWLAPELLDPDAMGMQSSRPTYMSDVYAFGMLCCEIYTRKRPFYTSPVPGKPVVTINANQLRRKVIAGERPRKPDNPSTAIMSDELFELVIKCWSHLRDDRPPMPQIVKGLKQL